MDEEMGKEEQIVSYIPENHETCWGCGLHLLLPSYSPVFKCGWCGAITYQNKSSRKPDSVFFSRWRLFRDRFFFTVLIFFMLFVIGAGIWASCPVIFSLGVLCGVLHITVAAILSISTMSTFFLAAFRSAGSPENILWGNYSVVEKDGLDNYTFCSYCAKPKPPRAHHCRSCRMCVLDMDHHCPFVSVLLKVLRISSSTSIFGIQYCLSCFNGYSRHAEKQIGNCVGAANHQYFVVFLISVVISCAYVSLMTVYAGLHVWPPLTLGARGNNRLDSLSILKQIMTALASSAFLLSARGLVLIYLAFASLSVEIGLSVLLWQQLYYIYEGNTYINHISAQSGVHGEGGCQNLLRFFGCRHSVLRFLLGPDNVAKLQETSASKLL